MLLNSLYYASINRLWTCDYGDRYPFNVSTNEGGLLETTLLDQDGFVKNPLPYLKKMHDEGGELNTPAVLVCPRDTKRKVAKDWAHLTTNNITYRFRASPETRPGSHTVLAVCPVDGNVLYSDGSVDAQQGKPATDDNGRRGGFHAQQVPLNIANIISLEKEARRTNSNVP